MDNEGHLIAISGAENRFLTFGSVELCGYVLTNGNRVLTRDSVQKSFGYQGTDPNWLYDFLLYLDKYRPIDLSLLAAIRSDIVFKAPHTSNVTFGILPNTLLAACHTIIKFKDDGFLFVSELKIAKVAEEMVKNLSQNANSLIDFASGHEFYKYNYKNALSRVIPSKYPYYKWAISFPDEFYEAIFQLKNWDWTDLRTLYASQYIHEIIFSRLDSTLLSDLTNSKPKIKYKKNNSFQQYIQHANLQPMVQSVITFIKASNQNEPLFLQLLNSAYPILNEKAYEGNLATHSPVERQFPNISEALKKILKATKN